MDNLTTEQVEELLKETMEWNQLLDPNDELAWMGQELSKLYIHCLECKQTEYPDADFYECSRMVKLNRFVSVVDMDRLMIPHANVCGVYARMDGIVVSRNVGKELFKDNHEYHDLLKGDYFIGTIQELANGKYFILKKGEFCPYPLNMSTSYKVLNL